MSKKLQRRRIGVRYNLLEDYLPSYDEREFLGDSRRSGPWKTNVPGGTYTHRVAKKGRLKRWIQSRKRKGVNVMGALSKIATQIEKATQPVSPS